MVLKLILGRYLDDKGNVLKDDFKELNCSMCGQKFAIPNKQIEKFKIKGWNLPNKCDMCKQIKDPDLKKCTKCNKQFKDKYNDLCQNCRGINITCSNCYAKFFFNDGEKDFYDKKNLSYPKKCKKCRNDKTTSFTSSKNTTNSILGSLWGWLK